MTWTLSKFDTFYSLSSQFHKKGKIQNIWHKNSILNPLVNCKKVSFDVDKSNLKFLLFFVLNLSESDICFWGFYISIEECLYKQIYVKMCAALNQKLCANFSFFSFESEIHLAISGLENKKISSTFTMQTLFVIFSFIIRNSLQYFL